MRYRRNISTPNILHVYPAEYNRDNLKGDFMVEKRRPVGTLEDIRKAFPDATLHIHLSDRVLVSEPIEGMKILRNLPTLESLKRSEKEGIRDAVRLMPWRSIGFRRDEYPLESITGDDIKGEWEVAKDDFLPFLQRELDLSQEKLARARAALNAAESYDPYSGKHLSEWETYFKARFDTLEKLITFLMGLTPPKYQAYVYSQKLLAAVTGQGKDFIDSQTFSTQFLDRVLNGEHPIDVWNWYLNLFKQYVSKPKQKLAFNLFQKHVLAWAFQHYCSEIYEDICKTQDANKLIDSVVELWKGFPKFEDKLRKHLCKYSSYSFWTSRCAHSAFEMENPRDIPTIEYLDNRLQYVIDVIAPAFAEICPKAGDNLIKNAESWMKELIRIYKL